MSMSTVCLVCVIETTSDGYPVIPSEDSHSSEYTSPCDARREYITGFTGSAGCAVVTQDKAALATDGLTSPGIGISCGEAYLY